MLFEEGIPEENRKALEHLKMSEEMDAEMFNYLYGTGKDADGMRRQEED
jgi:hypothetical protein